jgi:uncharacterized membrane protein
VHRHREFTDFSFRRGRAGGRDLFDNDYHFGAVSARRHDHGSGHGHGHEHRRSASPADRRLVIWLTALVGGLAAVTVVAMIVLWPHGPRAALPLSPDEQPAHLVHATALSVTPYDCESTGSTIGPDGKPTQVRCGKVVVRIRHGADAGRQASVLVQPEIYRAGVHPGDDLLVSKVDQGADVAPADSYAFADFARSTPMVALGVLFAVLVVAVARLRGLAAMAGLGVAALVLTKFMLPALLDGRSALAVGVVGGAAILFVVLYVAHGVSVRTTTALLGTLLGLATTALLGWVAVAGFHLSGLGSEDDQYLSAFAGQIQLSGLLLCGLVIASLGVLNDVTVTQASAVWELYQTDPTQSRARLFAAGMRIGRDHIASTVYTLVFAYAGTALPVLLLITIAHAPLGGVLTSEPLAEEVARTLVGSIGLVLAVPLTTAVATGLVGRGATSADR